jgi:cell division protein ZapA (FtsZ GTPase activity inhibitor)
VRSGHLSTTLTFMQIEGTIAIHPLAMLRPSKQIRNDEDLSWEEMLDVKNTMLHFMAKSGVWLVEHAESLAALFVALELHPRNRQMNGKKTLMLYQSHVQREWFDALKRDEGFNIELIQDNLLQAIAEEVNNRVQEMNKKIQEWEIEQVWIHTSVKSRPCANYAPPPYSPRPA